MRSCFAALPYRSVDSPLVRQDRLQLGFNEWYFADPSHHQQFLASVPSINWGEKFPK